MLRPVVALAFASVLVVPLAASAQGADMLIRELGASPVITNPSFPAEKGLEYKVAWDVAAGPDTPGAIVAGFRRPANFLVMAEQEGIPRKKVQLALIVHGPATQSLLRREAYETATGVENQNIPLLTALHEAGVKIIVCGQALISRKVPRDGLLPFVQVATSATMARAVLHAQGYVTFEQ